MIDANFDAISMLEFAKAREAVSYYELAAELGVSPANVERKLRLEAEEKGEIEYFLRTSLVRQMRHYVPNGVRMHGEWKLIRALSSWIAMVGNSKEIERRCKLIADRIQRDTELAADWIPANTNDEKLLKYFSV